MISNHLWILPAKVQILRSQFLILKNINRKIKNWLGSKFWKNTNNLWKMEKNMKKCLLRRDVRITTVHIFRSRIILLGCAAAAISNMVTINSNQFATIQIDPSIASNCAILATPTQLRKNERHPGLNPEISILSKPICHLFWKRSC